LPQRVVSAAIDLDTLLLAMAMAALGLSTHVRALRQAGIKPLLLGSLLFAWLTRLRGFAPGFDPDRQRR
jgi:uncharacterized membrane protein YadS